MNANDPNRAGALEALAGRARQAAIRAAALSTETKNAALAAVAQALLDRQQEIVAANRQDVRQAERDRISPVLLKRLNFDAGKLQTAVEGVRSLIALADPVGRTLRCMELEPGLELYQVTCPIGVLGIVFESRPDALVQISTLALKSGNAVLLKGGAEAARTNRILAEVIDTAAIRAGIPAGWLVLLETREDVRAMLTLDRGIDLIIPRGSNAFVRYIMDNTRIPVLGHAEGVCHVYVDRDADLEMAVRIAYDAKCQYPAVCNAAETLVVDAPAAEAFLPRIQAEYDRAGVELRGDQATRAIIACQEANEQDWRLEYNDLILSIRIVGGVDAAIDHINAYGSHHTDAIVTRNARTARRFLARVDSAGVFWNCSTRFSDGYRYGLGAEVGIATGKLHARGPVGLEGLVSTKWLLLGRGQTVAEFAGPNARQFTHRALEKHYEP